MRSRKAAVPDSVIRLERQFEQFRSTRTGRAKLPEPLWQAAVEQARQHGANAVAHTLRLDYNALKKRMAQLPIQYREGALHQHQFLVQSGDPPALPGRQ
jgi:hypothetical protein